MRSPLAVGWVDRQETQQHSLFTHKGEQAIWQRRFWEHQLCDEADFVRHVEYIHYNPMSHGLVKRRKIGHIRVFIGWCDGHYMQKIGEQRVRLWIRGCGQGMMGVGFSCFNPTYQRLRSTAKISTIAAESSARQFHQWRIAQYRLKYWNSWSEC